MQYRSRAYLTATLVVILLTIAGIGCGSGNSGKMPITTSSDEALDYYVKGRDLAERLRGQESIEYFQKAIALDSNFALAYLNLAFSSASAKEFFENFDKARSLIDHVSEGERNWILGVEAGNNAMPSRQREYFQRIVDMYPKDERAHNILAGNYFAQQQWEEAISEYTKAIDINPRFSPPYNQLGYAYRFLGRYQDAEHAFRRYIKLIPDDPNPYDSYGELLLKMGRYNQSIQSYEKALTINSSFAPSHIGIATNLNLKGKHDKAREQLAEMYDTAPSDGQRRAALFGMAVSYADEGKLDSAVIMLRKQYALAEKISDAAAMAGDLQIIGTVLYEARKFDQAADAFDKALKIVLGSQLSPEIKENARRTNLYLTARLALVRGDIEKARAKWKEYHDEVVKLDNYGQIRLAHDLAGRIALEKDDYDQALTEFGQANQQDPYILFLTGLAYERKGDLKSAREMYSETVNFNQISSINYSLVRSRAQAKLSTLRQS